jgi:alpha,alpha-trehalase
MFNVDVIHYLPVCLNALLYKLELDLAFFYEELSFPASEVQKWKDKAEQRKKAVNELLWDEESGMYFDYHFVTKQKRRYEFATTFFPLWAGLASEEQVLAYCQS